MKFIVCRLYQKTNAIDLTTIQTMLFEALREIIKSRFGKPKLKQLRIW